MKHFFSFLFVLLFVHIFAQDSLWIRYPSISPDGQNIVFNYQGNIYKTSINGGESSPIIFGESYEFNAIWSHNGSKIAYASDINGQFDIYLLDLKTLENKRLTYHSSAQVPCGFSTDDSKVYFSTHLQDDYKNIQFPTSMLPELYAVPVEGGRIEQILSTPAESPSFSKNNNLIYYHDKKGYENIWRKHHKSAITRDIWVYNKDKDSHTKLTSFEGEDRNPILSSDEKNLYYLSEKSGSFNIYKMNLETGTSIAITNFRTHPIRFLSKSKNDRLCFSYNGNIYTIKEGETAKKVELNKPIELLIPKRKLEKFTDKISEMAVSPNGKEVAFIIRGEVYVSSSDYSRTKRITNTPSQERSVSFNPSGRALLYSGERNGSWNIYQSKIINPEEKLFSYSTLLEEESILENKQNTFQARYSPDGKEVAFLENRVELKVINLESKNERTVLPASFNYSYSDGDQDYEWSPNGKYFLVQYLPQKRWVTEIGLVASDGKTKPINLTKSGYSDSSPQWILGGAGIMWYSDRNGMRSHGSWGSMSDAYALLFNKKAYEFFQLTQEDIDTKYNGTDSLLIKNIDTHIDTNLLEDRIIRLTPNSSELSSAILTKDGKYLLYTTSFEKGYDLWLRNIKKNEVKLISKLGTGSISLKLSKDNKTLFALANGKMTKFKLDNIESPEKKPIPFTANFNWIASDERNYIFEHAWRQTLDKFYVADMQSVDWKAYGDNYKQFLKSINNNYDFAELLSEMLGELNASHTGGRFFNKNDGYKTKSLGVFFDYNYKGDGIKVAEIIEQGPLDLSDVILEKGIIIEKINGQKITKTTNFYQLLNTNEKYILLSIFNPNQKKRKDILVKAISLREENNLLYKRFVKQMQQITKEKSNGKLAYVHVRGMNDASFRKVYSDLLGANVDKDAVIVDTRYNGGGWLHDDLVTLLSGKRYADMVPRGQYIGSEPMEKWYKPSVVLISEGNYSDAHGFPFAYNALNIGTLVGMPVAGTMTAVWWERQIDQSLVFGIPQVGFRDIKGNYVENHQLEPNVKIRQDYSKVVKGIDQQLEKAIELLLDK